MKINKLFFLILPLVISISGCKSSNPSVDPGGGGEEDPTQYEDIDNDGNWNSRKNIINKDLISVEKSAIRDKVLGGLIGNAIGLGSGFEYVHGEGLDALIPEGTKSNVAMADKYFETDGYLLCGTLGENNDKSYCPVNPPKTILCDPRVGKGYVVSDDDMHVDITFQYLLREKGPFIDAYDVTHAWSSDGFAIHDAGGGGDIRENANNYQYISPYLGQRLYGNKAWYITEPWIENDLIGLDFPYMPKSCDTLAAFTGGATGDGYANYLGRLLALMTSLSYQYDDAKEVMEKAFDYFDKNNQIYEMYTFVKNEYEDNVPWREACLKVADRRIWTSGYPSDNSMLAGGFSADFSITSNAGMIFLGLFYGENDFVETVKITSLCGLDGDCTAASVGQIIGTIVGFDSFPDRYKECLNGESYYYNYCGSAANKEEFDPGWDGVFAFCEKKIPYKTSFNDLTDIIVGNIEDQIIAYGGNIEESTYQIAKQELETSKYIEIPNYSFEECSTAGWESENATFDVDNTSSNFRNKDSKNSGKLTGFGKAYQNVNLIKGHKYKLSLFVRSDCDNEIRLFANDNYISFVKSKTYVTATAYNRLYFDFVAEQKDYKVGIELVDGVGTSTTVNFDDLEISDITNYVESYYQSYDIKYFYGNEGTYNSNNNAVLSLNSSLKFEYMGYDGIQNFRFFFSNNSSNLANVSLYIDNVFKGILPVQINGTIDFSKVGSQDALFFSGKGKHIMKITLSSGSNLTLNRVEIDGTNPYSDRGIIE